MAIQLVSLRGIGGMRMLAMCIVALGCFTNILMGQLSESQRNNLHRRWVWSGYWSREDLEVFTGRGPEFDVEFSSGGELLGLCVLATRQCSLYRIRPSGTLMLIGRGPCMSDEKVEKCVEGFVRNFTPVPERSKRDSRQIWREKISVGALGAPRHPCKDSVEADLDSLRTWLRKDLKKSEVSNTRLVIPCSSKDDPEVYILFERPVSADSYVVKVSWNTDGGWKVVGLIPQSAPKFDQARERILGATALTDEF